MKEILDLLKELLDGGIQKVLGYILIPVLPIIALSGNFHATENYWWDLLIAFGITGLFVLLIWLWLKDK